MVVDWMARQVRRLLADMTPQAVPKLNLIPTNTLIVNFAFISYFDIMLNEFPNPKMVLVDKNEKGGREYLRGIQD